MSNEIRFVTPEQSIYILERITYEKWCNHLTVHSCFLNDKMMEQAKFLIPETTEVMMPI